MFGPLTLPVLQYHLKLFYSHIFIIFIFFYLNDYCRFFGIFQILTVTDIDDIYFFLNNLCPKQK